MRKLFYLILILIIFGFDFVFAFGLKIDNLLPFRQEEDGIHRYLKISQTLPKSFLAIYSVNNPKHPEPEYVYGIEINETGKVEIDLATLFEGEFVVVNTLEEGACNALSLEDCRKDSGYLTEFSFKLNQEQIVEKLLNSNFNEEKNEENL